MAASEQVYDRREQVSPHHSDEGPYVQCEICADYIVAPPGGLLCKCHRGNGHRSAAASPSWPVLDGAALYGLPGEIVDTAAPHTEADTPALLANILVGFGNAAGRNAHVKVGADRHNLNLFVVLVGETSKGRKGSSWSPPRDLLHTVEPSWVEDRVIGGLSTGEGLIHAVRDRVVSEDDDGKLTVLDEGASDKRLLALESEFAGPLKVMTCATRNTR